MKFTEFVELYKTNSITITNSITKPESESESEPEPKPKPKPIRPICNAPLGIKKYRQ